MLSYTDICGTVSCRHAVDAQRIPVSPAPVRRGPALARRFLQAAGASWPWMNDGSEGESDGMDWQQHEDEARQAIEQAAGMGALDDARVRYLGRKSELATALREVRERESGMLLNGIRARLEEAVDRKRDTIE